MHVLGDYLDLLEDGACERGSLDEFKERRITLYKEIKKLMPVHYRFEALPAHFNYIDPERVRKIIGELASDFLRDAPAKVMFGLGVRVYSFHNSVVSVRVLIAKFYQLT